MSASIGILAVDDSLVVRSLLSRLIDAEPDLHLVSTAVDGRQAVDKLSTVKPDVVVLDVEMPVMNGLEALIEIRKKHPHLPVIMFSNLTRTGATTTLEALANGARDYAAKPQGSVDATESFEDIRQNLFPKIRQAHQIQLMRTQRRGNHSPSTAASGPSPTARPPAERVPEANSPIEAVVLGTSTGGPVALETVLRAIIPPLPVPIIVVQHMPAVFTKALADRLDTKVASTVVEAEPGMQLEAGTCYIAPGGYHLRVEKSAGRGVHLTTNQEPAINGCRPSVEPLFASAAEVFGSRLAAVMLTGVGKDGSKGAATIAGNGSPIIVQDEASSVVWGMPGVIAQAGHATSILPIERIGRAMSELRFASKVGAA